ncbi:MAG: CaiB/BaiF CoA transferase family protein [Acidimicrobiia bacterium]
MTTAGPLDGLAVIELAGIGPGPFAAGLMGDLGATVVRIERASGATPLPMAAERIGVRDRVVLHLDLKDEQGLATAKDLIASADVLVEGFRPGVAERLGLGPEVMTELNPAIVYLRISGWGQEGPYAQMAGHDINYVGLSGVLAAIGDARPIPPLNLVGDYAGGALYGVIGVLAALVSRGATSRGAVIDAAMVDGSAALLAPILDLMAAGLWSDQRSSNLLDGGAPFYRTYETADGSFMAVGALEEPFYQLFVEGLELDARDLPSRMDPGNWSQLASEFSSAFAERTQQEWCEVFDGTDACVTPVLAVADAAAHPHNRARDLYREREGDLVPHVAPRIEGLEVRRREDAAVSDILMATGLSAETARRLESEGLSYWV